MLSCQLVRSFSSLFFFLVCCFLSSAASSYFSDLIACSFLTESSSICVSSFLISFGTTNASSLVLEEASSIRSIALSGRNLSLIYLLESLTAAHTASSVITTLWCSSYLGLSPISMSIASSSVGSSTLTG